MRMTAMASCSECERELPGGTAYDPGGNVGPADKRKLDCPYCGAPLEPIRWTDLGVLAAVLGLLMLARKLLGPLIDWKVFVVVGTIGVVHHFLAWRKWRAKKRETVPRP